MPTSVFSWLVSSEFAAAEEKPEHNLFLRALKHAQFAMGSTHPNPAVGAVIVKDGVVIGEGFTHAPGQMHAEIHALSLATPSLLKGATLYVTLEPCSHFGRTPPCTDAIIKSGISNVVFGVMDPNPKVAGAGIDALTRANINVQMIDDERLRDLAQAHHRPFQIWIKEKRPYVLAKIATSRDGFFSATKGKGSKITGHESDIFVHRMRRAADAIMIGGETARIDDPMLTARLCEEGHGQQPASIVVSGALDLSPQLKIFNRGGMRSILIAPNGYMSAADLLRRQGVEIICVPTENGRINLASAFTELARLGFTMIMVEAGPILFTHLVSQHLVDEAFWFRSQHAFASDGPRIEHLQDFIENHYEKIHERACGDDDLRVYARTN